jgi:hypothetical protein
VARKFDRCQGPQNDGRSASGKQAKIQADCGEELGRSSDEVYALIDPQSRDALFQTLNAAVEAKTPELPELPELP